MRIGQLSVVAIVTLIACGICTTAPAQPPDDGDENRLQIDGRVESVTVYRGQAMVARLLDLPASPESLREVIVSNLPEHVVPGSIFAEVVFDPEAAQQAAGVRSVRYRIRPVSEDVREEVRALDAQILGLRDGIADVEKEQQVLQQRKSFLDRLENFSADMAMKELTHGVLDAEQLTGLARFVLDDRAAIARRELELERLKRSLQHELDLVQRQRNQITGRSTRNVREAIVFLSVPAHQPVQVRLHYLVSGATWSPSYNLRKPAAVNGAPAESVVVEYYASIHQMSGEDWSNVAMTLSTATPSLMAMPPKLEPLSVRLEDLSRDQLAQAVQQQRYVELRSQFEMNAIRENERRRVESFRHADAAEGPARIAGAAGVASAVPASATEAQASKLGLDDGLNRWATQLQVLDLVAGERAERSERQSDTTQGVSVTYELAGRTSMPSRSDQQLIQIARLQLPASFANRAVPVLGPYVYEEARVRNASNLVLLAGPAQAYVAGEFVGRAAVPMVAVGESFDAGFGIDPSLRATRELVARSERTQGGNRVVEFTYKLVVENFGSQAAPVRLLDRLPHPADRNAGSAINVELVSAQPGISEDADYLRTARQDGILRWDLVAPADATGGEALEVTYRFTVEHDRQKTLATADGDTTVPRY
jgi:hypothetical protein